MFMKARILYLLIKTKNNLEWLKMSVRVSLGVGDGTAESLRDYEMADRQTPCK